MLTMTASGSVSDYENTTSLQISIATLAGVDASVAPFLIPTLALAQPYITMALALNSNLSPNHRPSASQSPPHP